MAGSFAQTTLNVLKGKTEPQMQFSAWAWRKTARILPPSAAPVVYFAVPLVSRRRSGDWTVVQDNLARTIAAFRNQSSSAWEAVICGQDRPEGIAFDEQVRFLPYSGSDKFYDKGDKRVALLRHIAGTSERDGYYMQFDADDILHPEFVSHVVGDNNGRGYVISKGLIADLSSDLFAELASLTRDGAPRKAFNQMCGSSNAVRVDFRPEATGSVRLLEKLKAHSRIEAQMARHGLPLDPVPFFAAIYLVNHGENMVDRRGRMGRKLAFLEREAITAPERLSEIRRGFRLDDLPHA